MVLSSHIHLSKVHIHVSRARIRVSNGDLYRVSSQDLCQVYAHQASHRVFFFQGGLRQVYVRVYRVFYVQGLRQVYA